MHRASSHHRSQARDREEKGGRLRQAGAIILGKANMSTFAFSYDGISEPWACSRPTSARAWQAIGYPAAWDTGGAASGSRGDAAYYYDAFLQRFGVDPYLSLPAVAPLIPSTPNFLNF